MSAGEASESEPAPSGYRVSVHLLACACVLALGLFANRGTLRQGILGFDSYIQINTSRVESASDFVENFTQPLTDGRIVARFYRPVQNLSIALDYALWELEPFGYQLSSWLSYGIAALLVYLTCLRVLGRGGLVGAVVATAFWALHPLLLNVLPVPCRRSDTLVTSFLCLGLLCLPATAEQRLQPVRWILSGLCVLFAAASKDIGVMGLGLIFLYRLAVGSDEEGRLRAALRASVPALVAVIVYMVGRTLVLGGFGGYVRGEDDPGSYLGRVQNFGTALLQESFYPSEFLPTGLQPSGWSHASVALILAGGLLALGLWFWLQGAVVRRPACARPAILILLGVAWLLPPVVALGFLKWDAPWYAVHPLVGIGFVLGGCAEAACSALRGPLVAKVEGAFVLVFVTVIAVCGLRFSPLWSDYPEWDVATAAVNETLTTLDTKLSTAQLGDQIHLRNTPYPEMPEKPDSLALRWVAGIDRKGMQAWAEMRYPHLNTRTKLRKQKLLKPRGDDEVIIVVNNLGRISH